MNFIGDNKATKPCLCGYAGDTRKACRCSPENVAHYVGKISGPLMDRIDLHISVPRPGADILAGGGPPAEASAIVRQRVIDAREIQMKGGALNCELRSEEFNDDGLIEPEAKALLKEVAERKALSARSWFRALKVARTIADLGREERISSMHIAVALNLRMFDLS